MIEVLEVGLKEMKDNPDLTYSYWYLTGKCNYRCDYCDIYKDEIIQPWEVKKKIIDFFNYWGKKKQQKVLLYGGEPTLDPDLPKILASLDDYVRLFTNLSKDIDYWKYIDSIRDDITISISYHYSNTIDDISMMEKVLFLIQESKKITKIRLKIMADSRNIEKAIELFNKYNKLKSPKYECYMDIVMPNSQGDIGAQWKDKDMDWFLALQDHQTLYLKYKENGIVKERDTSWNEMRVTMLESNHYYHCMAGTNTLYVDSNGDVFPCKSHTNHRLFNIVEDGYEGCEIPRGMVCNYMGFCCETEIPKRLVCRRKVGEQTKNIRNKLL